MLDGVSSLRVDGVRIFLTSFIIEVTIVSTRRHSSVGHIQHRLVILIDVHTVIRRLCHTNTPGQSLLAVALGYDLTTYLYHEIRYSLALQQTCYAIGTIALCNRRTV